MMRSASVPVAVSTMPRPASPVTTTGAALRDPNGMALLFNISASTICSAGSRCTTRHASPPLNTIGAGASMACRIVKDAPCRFDRSTAVHSAIADATVKSTAATTRFGDAVAVFCIRRRTAIAETEPQPTRDRNAAPEARRRVIAADRDQACAGGLRVGWYRAFRLTSQRHDPERDHFGVSQRPQRPQPGRPRWHPRRNTALDSRTHSRGT